MKSTVRILSAFIVGVLAGALVTFILLGRINARQYAKSYALSLREQVFIASQLRSHRAEDLSKRAEANLVPGVQAIQQRKDLQSEPESQTALREIKYFYETNSLPIPEEIAGFLNSLPPTH